MRLMEESLGADIELDAVARGAGLSRPHFYKLFRTQTGLTPNLYVNTLLMEQAIDSLVGSEISVADIGYDLGFLFAKRLHALLCRQCGHGADAIPPGRPCPLARHGRDTKSYCRSNARDRKRIDWLNVNYGRFCFAMTGEFTTTRPVLSGAAA